MPMDRPEDELPNIYMDAAQAVVGMHPFPSIEETGKAIEAVRRAILKAREEAFEEAAKIAEGEVVPAFLFEGVEKREDNHMEGREFMRDFLADAIRQHSQKGER